jgi:hypothetical protein
MQSEGFENRSTAAKFGRLVNRQILLDDDFWVVGPTNKYWPTLSDGSKQGLRGKLPAQEEVTALRKKYGKFVESWEALIPNEGERRVGGGGGGATVTVGGDQKFSTMLKILGQGVFITLSCSPSHVDIAGHQGSERGMLAHVAWEKYMAEVCKKSLAEWRGLFGGRAPEVRRHKSNLKLEVSLDDYPRFLEGAQLRMATRLARKSVAGHGCSYLTYSAQIHDYGMGGGRRRRKKTKRRRRKTRKRRSQRKRRRTRRRRHGRKTRRRRHRRKMRRRGRR